MSAGSAGTAEAVGGVGGVEVCDHSAVRALMKKMIATNGALPEFMISFQCHNPSSVRALQYNLRLERICMTDTTHLTPYEPEPVQTGMNINYILKILPHRFPFLLIDRVVQLERMKSIVAPKNVPI